MKITKTTIYAKACAKGQLYLKKHDTLEAAWNACKNIDWMVWALRAAGIADDEKAFRLFGHWCCRETPLSDGRKRWDLLADERIRDTVSDAASDAVWAAARASARASARVVARVVNGDATWAAASDAQVAQFRAIISCPFDANNIITQASKPEEKK